ncbi:cyclodeaminase/cyclohydrolase family protein, partial [Bacillus cereus]|uniref:cyclodeaminase/cyclohydrolase family protein n=1 Tax=Bacillus cereus TaxID=1396 RepID=UPI003644AFA1
RSVITDVAAASEAARAAATTARLNVEINLGAISDLTARAELRKSLEAVDDICGRAATLDTRTRELIGRPMTPVVSGGESIAQRRPSGY